MVARATTVPTPEEMRRATDAALYEMCMARPYLRSNQSAYFRNSPDYSIILRLYRFSLFAMIYFLVTLLYALWLQGRMSFLPCRDLWIGLAFTALTRISSTVLIQRAAARHAVSLNQNTSVGHAQRSHS